MQQNLFLFFTTLVLGIAQAERKIVGGLPTTIQQYPYQASFEYQNKFICSAAIVKPNKVLTSARCTIGKSPNEVQVRVGSSFKGRGGQLVNVKEINQHPDYDTCIMFSNNIAVLTLEKDLVFNENVSSVALPNYQQFEENGVHGVLTGWGYTDTLLKDQLHAVYLKKQTYDRCRDAYLMWSPETVCYANKEAVGGCSDDGGAPLVNNGFLLGIFSWTEACADEDYPNVFANVAILRYFIDLYV